MCSLLFVWNSHFPKWFILGWHDFPHHLLSSFFFSFSVLEKQRACAIQQAADTHSPSWILIKKNTFLCGSPFCILTTKSASCCFSVNSFDLLLQCDSHHLDCGSRLPGFLSFYLSVNTNPSFYSNLPKSSPQSLHAACLRAVTQNMYMLACPSLPLWMSVCPSVGKPQKNILVWFEGDRLVVTHI